MIVLFQRFLFIVLLFLTLPVQAQAVFSELKWNNRVLVLSAGDDQGALEEQIFMLRDVIDGLEERELIVLELRSRVLEQVDGLSPFPFEARILDSRQERRYLQSLFQSDFDQFKLTLIGLDGEVKEVWEEVTVPEDIFAVIDAMPMRQNELKN